MPSPRIRDPVPYTAALDPIKVEGAGPLYEGVLAVCERRGYRVVHEGDAALFVLANSTRIVRKAEREAPPLKTICFHPSVLPRHRGRDAVYWTIKMGDTQTGVTWFWIDDGIDTGPIAVTRSIPLPAGLRPRDVYEQYLVPLGVEAFEELLDRLEAGEVPRIVQDESLATYEPPRERAKGAAT